MGWKLTFLLGIIRCSWVVLVISYMVKQLYFFFQKDNGAPSSKRSKIKLENSF